MLKNDAILAPTTPSHDVLAMSSTENVSTHDVRSTGKKTHVMSFSVQKQVVNMPPFKELGAN